MSIATGVQTRPNVNITGANSLSGGSVKRVLVHDFSRMRLECTVHFFFSIPEIPEEDVLPLARQGLRAQPLPSKYSSFLVIPRSGPFLSARQVLSILFLRAITS